MHQVRKKSETYVFVLGNDVLEELGVDFCVVPALLEADAIYLARLHLWGRVRRIHLFKSWLEGFSFVIERTYL